MEGFQGMLWNGLSFNDSKILKALGVSMVVDHLAKRGEHIRFPPKLSGLELEVRHFLSSDFFVRKI